MTQTIRERRIGSIALVAVVFSMLMGCSVSSPSADRSPSWVLVFENDPNGNPVSGSKADLLAAVRNGQPVRVFLPGRRVDHAVDAVFLSLIEGEVFAQSPTIHAQAPEFSPPSIGFREPNTHWRAIVGTNGHIRALMDGAEPRQRTGSIQWFVMR
ncbi:MAG: hypothetical protein AAF662_00650 [Pseudomonadota bacterium]